jgi:CheY-like chemotaxis protein
MTAPVVASPLSEPIIDPLKKKRVLLVDTSSTKRDLRAEVMRKLGIDVDCAADITEARSWWRADLYNLVVLNVENDQGPRDKFCEDIRGATPPQQLAFLVGKPAYLAAAPSAEEVLLGEAEIGLSENHRGEIASSDLPRSRDERWGILEASRRISAVRSASHARSKAIRERPVPPRDYEVRASKQATDPRNLDELIRKEMR